MAQPDKGKKTSDRRPSPKVLYDRNDLTISVAADEMSAYLSFSPGKLPFLSEPLLKKALAEAGIAYGVNWGTIQDLVGKTDAVEDIVVAKGTPPVDGEPPRLDYKFPTNPYAIIGAQSDNEKVDYKERSPLPFARAGDEVAVLIAGGDPVPGISVIGNEIKGQIVLAGGIEPGRNVEMVENRFLAKIDGGPRLDEHGRIEVVDVWPIHGDIDIRTGIIRYPGKIDIKGVVQSGFEVHAKEIKVYGVENKAVVESGGNLIITGGILGGRVKAAGNLSARFINKAHVSCEGDVVVMLSIVNSEVECGGRLEAQTIIGGSAMAYKGFELTNLGSTSSRSSIIFGVDPIKAKRMSQLVKRKLDIAGKLAPLQDEVAPLTQLEERLERASSEVEKLKSEKTDCEKRINATDASTAEFLRERIQAIEPQIETYSKQIKKLKEEIPVLKEQFAEQLQEISTMTKQVEALEEEQLALESEEETLNFIPRIAIKGQVLSGTHISGRRARVVLRKDYQRVVFTERKRTDADVARAGGDASKVPLWRISIERL